MDRHAMVAELVSDMHEQIDQMRPRGIKDAAGNPYYPSYYIRGLDTAQATGDDAVVGYVRRYLSKAPSDGYKKLEDADSLDLAVEALVADETKVYASLFSDEERTKARERLAPHQAAIDARKAARRERIDAKRAELRASGIPRRSELDAGLRSRGGQ